MVQLKPCDTGRLAQAAASDAARVADSLAPTLLVCIFNVYFYLIDFFVQFMCGMKNGGVATLIITLVVIVLKSFPFCETSWYF